MADTLRERLRNRGEQIDKVVDDAQTGDGDGDDKPKPKPKPKPKKPAESTGVGKPSFDLEGAIAKLRAQIEATNDPQLKAKLKARIEAMKANQ